MKLDARRNGVSRSQQVNLQKGEALARSARDAWKRHHYEQTIALYEQALRRDPKNHLLLIDLARAYGLRYQLTDAELMIDRVLRLYPRSAKVRSMVAATFAMINRPAQAIEHYRKALELNPQHPESTSILSELASLLEQDRCLEEAIDAIERALALAPDRLDLRCKQALLQIRRGDEAVGMGQLEQIVARSDTPTEVRSDAWYELGRLHDRAGSYDAAFEAFTSAKQLLSPQAERFRLEADFLRERHRVMLSQLTPDCFRRWQEKGPANRRRSIALLTGHPRSGTTLLEQVLDGHSQLISADEFMVMGEHVFRPIAATQSGCIPTPEGLTAIDAARIAALRDDYWRKTESLVGQGIGPRMLLDKNPSLSYLLPVILRVFPEMKVLFALRDPRDVVLSCFMQRMPINAISSNYLSLEAAAAKYADAMHYWLTIRPMLYSDWLEVKYEDTVSNIDSQARSVLEFLGLAWEPGVVDFHAHAQNKRVRSPTSEDVTKPVYTHAIGRWRNYEKYMQPVQAMLEPYIKEFGYFNS